MIYGAMTMTYGDLCTMAYNLGYILLSIGYGIEHLAAARYVCGYGR